MRLGTKSLVFGAHQFILHPIFIAVAWYQTYGFRCVWIGDITAQDYEEDGYGKKWFSPYRKLAWTSLWSPKLWLAFLVHDWGYWQLHEMDDAEGELHPLLGAKIMHSMFGDPWYEFMAYHSRFLAKKSGAKPSALCIPDKLAIIVPPRWLYLTLVRLSGEIHEYMAKSSTRNETGNKYASMNLRTSDQILWYEDMCSYVRRWVDAHKDGQDDTWTPAA